MQNKNNINDKISFFFDEAAQSWDKNNLDELSANRILQIPTFAECIKGANVLDIGCGTGVMEQPLLDCEAKSITAIDLSPKMIQIAKSKICDDRVRYFCDDVLNITGTFDVVIMYNVYPHLQNRIDLIKHISENTTAGSRVIIAHGDGKDNINSHHKAHAAGVSLKLDSASNESKIWETILDIDVLIDKEDLFCISGICR